MSESTICPYCRAKLRLGSSAHRSTRVKCRSCQRGFHPTQVVANDGSAQSLNQPLTAPRLTADGGTTPASPEPNSRPTDEARGSAAESLTIIQAEAGQPESIDPRVAESAFPADMLARRAARHNAARERVEERVGRRRHKMKAHEIALAFGMVVAGIGGASYLGWRFLRQAPARDGAADSTASRSDSSDGGNIKSVLDSDLAPKALPRRLIGIWELRSDDERRGWVEYREDGKMLARAWDGDLETSPTQANWYLVDQVGDDFVIDLGPERGSLKNVRFFLSVSGDDAYTLKEVRTMGIPRREEQRFVRRGARGSVGSDGSKPAQGN